MPKPNVRDKLLTAGLDTMHHLGFNGCSVQDIAQAADVPKGSFYNHFESKEAFGAEILDLYWQKMANTSLRILSDETLSPVERLKRHFNTLAEGLTDQNYERGCLLGNFGAELSDQSYLVRDRLSSLLAGWTRSIKCCVSHAQNAGEVRADLDAAILAAFLVNAWEGAVLRAKIDRDGLSLVQFNTIDLLQKSE
jgi:TetR/AcrR family transcriptional repressor of nem operon